MASSLAVILLNYKRPQNIGRIVRAAREALPAAPIFILDQASDDSLRLRDDIPWGEVWLQRSEVNRGAGIRFALAEQFPFDLYVAIDDDTLLSAFQIRRLAELVAAEPDRAHGVYGQRLEIVGDILDFRNALGRQNAPLSVLNLAYAFSRGQAAASLQLAAKLGISSWEEFGLVDDFLLCCASPKPPLCHDLGPIDACPTSGQPGVALWVTPGFYDRRIALARRLAAMRAITVFGPPGAAMPDLGAEPASE